MNAPSKRAYGWRILGLVGAWMLVTSGCAGSKKAEVSGTVHYQGKPLDAGSVVMVGSDGIPHTGAIGPDGTYTVKDLPAGEIRIGVVNPDSSPRPTKKTGRGSAQESNPEPTASLASAPPQTRKIPASYADVENSGLKTTLKKGTNTYDIPLQ